MDLLTHAAGPGAPRPAQAVILPDRPASGATVLAPLRLEAPPGLALADVVRFAQIPEVLHDRVILLLNGQVVRDWEHVFTREGDMLTIGVVPAGGDGGGKRIFAAVATLAIAVAAPYLAGALVGAIGLTGTAATVATTGLTAGISLIGALAISALIPPPSLGSAPLGASATGRGSDESPTYSLGGQANRARPYATVKRVYGRYRVHADLAAVPLVDNLGKTSTVSQLLYFSAGDCEIEDLRFEDQPFATFDPAYRVLQNSFGTNLRYVHRAVAYAELSYTLDDTEWLRLQTAIDSVKATVDLTFPRGLVRMSKAERMKMTAPVQVRWRAKNSGDAWRYLKAADLSGAPDSDVGGTTYEADYDFHPINEGPTTAWVVQTKTGKEDTVTRILVYRDGEKIHQSEDYEPGAEPGQVSADGTTYAAGQFLGDVSASEDTKSEVYAELLTEVAVDGNAVRVTHNTREPFTVGARMSFPAAGVYDIEVRRTEAPATSEVIADDIVVTLLRSFAAGPVLRLAHRATMLEMQVIASDQLRGSVPAVNALVSSRLRDLRASGFTGAVKESANPALIAVDILTGGPHGDQCRFPLKPAQVDFADFNRLRAICAEVRTQVVNGVTWTGPRFEWNGVIETDRPLGEVVNTVLGVARAQLRLTAAGKIGCLIDEVQTTPRALITPSNSWGFTGSRPFPEQPHALRVNFADEDRGYSPASVVLFNTGWSERTATIYEEIDAWGITNYAEAWRYGRFMLAQAILRSEVFSVSQDAEHLAAQRGELVHVQHDVPLHGGMAARVTEVAGTAIIIDRPFDGAPSGYVVRSNAGAISSGAVTAVTGPDSFAVGSGHGIDPGDLITIGELDQVTQPYLIRSIEPGEDFSARLELVRYDPDVYLDEEGPLPPWDPGFGQDLISGASIFVHNLKAAQAWAYEARRPVKEVRLAWKIGGDNPSAYFAAFIEFRRGGNDWAPVGNVTGGEREFTHRIDWEMRALWPENVTYRVRPFTALGNAGKPATVAIQLTDYNLRPQPPRNAFLDVRGQELTLTWDPSTSLDVVNYLVRYSPSVLGEPAWHKAIPLATLSWDQDQATVKARTGSYLLRAVNAIGKASTVVYLRTTIETLPDINVLLEVDESATWPGARYRFSKNGVVVTVAQVRLLTGVWMPVNLAPLSYDVLLLDGASSIDVGTLDSWGDGYLVSARSWDPEATQDRAVYTFDTIVDLGAIYETTLQAKHEAFAVRESDLATLLWHDPDLEAGLAAIDDSDPVAWTAWAEYRASSAGNPIRDWGPIDDHGPLATAGIEYGRWRKFHVTHATARYFQFRLLAESEEDAVRVVVTKGLIEVDMIDRQWHRNNVAIPSGGTRINFTPPFAATPVLAVTIEGSGTAIRYRATDVDRSGADIALFNAAGGAVAGQIDIAALGYGKQRSQVI